MNTIKKLTLSAIIAGAIFSGAIGLASCKPRYNPGWSKDRISKLEQDLEVPHDLVARVEMLHSGRGSLAPVSIKKDTYQNIQRINFEYAVGNGRVVADYFPDGRIKSAAFFDETGLLAAYRYDPEFGGVRYCSNLEAITALHSDSK